MSPTQLKHAAALVVTAGLAAAAVTVAPTLAADTTSTTPTTTAPTTAKGLDRPCPDGPRGGERGPAALRISRAAMRPDPPAAAASGTRAKQAKRAGKRAGRRNAAPSAGGAPNGGPPPGGPSADDRLANRTTHYAAIGKELGKDTAAVTAAVRTALSNELAARVKAGKITQDRADAILKAWDTGGRVADTDKADKPDAAAKGTRPSRADIAAEIAAFRKDVAGALGVSVDDLVAAIGKATPKPPTPKTDNG